MAVAAAAVNVFRTITDTVGTSTVGIYTAPVGYTGVLLLAQVTNIGSSTQTLSFGHRRNGSDTEIVKDLAIPANDTANLLAGKLVVETGDTLTIVGSTATDLKYLSSILETSNL
jgi:hypothetical protein|tara:strand:+ start:146 stop:487 length:342 start_codon:yes stop_codon:yes gene_type:complete